MTAGTELVSAGRATLDHPEKWAVRYPLGPAASRAMPSAATEPSSVSRRSDRTLRSLRGSVGVCVMMRPPRLPAAQDGTHLKNDADRLRRPVAVINFRTGIRLKSRSLNAGCSVCRKSTQKRRYTRRFARPKSTVEASLPQIRRRLRSNRRRARNAIDSHTKLRSERAPSTRSWKRAEVTLTVFALLAALG